LLDLSQEREGAGIPITRKPADLRVLCRQLVEELDVPTRDRRVIFDCYVDARGAWDESRILQAISNLTSNAIEHGVPGSPVRIRLTGDDERVVAEVQNEGTIPDELAPRIFEPFQSGREYQRRGHGVGLGLFIARAIARAHGGSLEFNTEAGTTTFRLVLPRHTPGDDPARGDEANS
jgi:signal transduction histidine kinase